MSFGSFCTQRFRANIWKPSQTERASGARSVQEPSHIIPRMSVAPCCDLYRKFDSDCKMQKSLWFCMRWMGYAEILTRARARQGEAQGVLSYQNLKTVFTNPHMDCAVCHSLVGQLFRMALPCLRSNQCHSPCRWNTPWTFYDDIDTLNLSKLLPCSRSLLGDNATMYELFLKTGWGPSFQ